MTTLALLATVSVVLLGLRIVLAYQQTAPNPSTAAEPSHLAEIGPTLTEPNATEAGTVDPPTAQPTPTSPPPTPVPTPTVSSGDPLAPSLIHLLDQVTVLPNRPNPPGYDRGCGPGEGCVFGTEWNDDTDAPDGRNGCDTRNDVLRRDLQDTLIDPDTNGCVVLSGLLIDPYTGAAINFVRGPESSLEVQIDHLIPLAAAWDLGAWRWPPTRRAAFANDTRNELLAVSGAANMAKSDSTPASWLPPNKDYRCEYGVRYLRAALQWNLPITAADAEVLGHVARKCA